MTEEMMWMLYDLYSSGIIEKNDLGEWRLHRDAEYYLDEMTDAE